MKQHRHNPLFYTKTGELDTGQFVLLVCCAVAMALAIGISWFHMKDLSGFCWGFLGSFTTMCFINGATKDRARMIANSKAEGEVARGITSIVVTPQQWSSGDPDAGKM